MNILFIQGGSRWKFDTEGNLYIDSNFSKNVLNRYKSYCDEFTVVLRKEEKIYSKKEAKEKFNVVDVSLIKYISIPDVYHPSKNILNLSYRKEIDIKIKQAVKNADKIIIRSLGNVYTNTALKYAVKFDKPYLIEVTGYAFEGMWYHSLRGKVLALIREYTIKSMIKKAPYVVYVTNEALQHRYPCYGKTLGCSDVELTTLDEKILENRISKINTHTQKTIIGTAAFLDVKYKGQETVIKALSILKSKGINNIEYQLIGNGKGLRIKKLANKYGVENQVKIIGELPHNEVFGWFDNIDIYVHPSYTEGLCRSIIEAISRACPVIACNVGGNYELIEKNMLFKRKDYIQLSVLLEKVLIPKNMEQISKRNYKKAKEYQNNILDIKRTMFYEEFINGK